MARCGGRQAGGAVCCYTLCVQPCKLCERALVLLLLAPMKTVHQSAFCMSSGTDVNGLDMDYLQEVHLACMHTPHDT